MPEGQPECSHSVSFSLLWLLSAYFSSSSLLLLYLSLSLLSHSRLMKNRVLFENLRISIFICCSFVSNTIIMVLYKPSYSNITWVKKLIVLTVIT